MRHTSNILIALTTTVVSLLSIAPGFCGDTASSSDSKFYTPDPKTAMEHNNRAVELGSKGRWEEALAEHEIAIKEDESDAKKQGVSKTKSTDTFRMNLSSACLRYGDILVHDKKLDDAKKIFQKALDADSNNRPAQEKLAKLLQQESEKSNGSGASDAAQSQKPNKNN